jgi:GH25 family lysozyme M1 (1,4-beta-N-acetylmuramidase)
MVQAGAAGHVLASCASAGVSCAKQTISSLQINPTMVAGAAAAGIVLAMAPTVIGGLAESDAVAGNGSSALSGTGAAIESIWDEAAYMDGMEAGADGDGNGSAAMEGASALGYGSAQEGTAQEEAGGAQEDAAAHEDATAQEETPAGIPPFLANVLGWLTGDDAGAADSAAADANAANGNGAGTADGGADASIDGDEGGADGTGAATEANGSAKPAGNGDASVVNVANGAGDAGAADGANGVSGADAEVDGSVADELASIETSGDGEAGAIQLLDVQSFAEPDISGDCPVVWMRNADGSFSSNGGGTLGSGCLFGVDVSSHNGDIDWEAAKDAGLDFAIIRIGYGADKTEYDDELWERNASECERLGIPYGAYLYSYAPEPDWCHTEADHAIRLLKGHNPQLGVWYDIEEGSQAEAYGYNSDLFYKLVMGFKADVESATGIEVGLYTSSSWLRGHLDKVYESGIPVWCACWADSAPGGLDYLMWQAGTAIMPGFDGEVDFDAVIK